MPPELDPEDELPATEARLDASVFGRVQGVGYRYFVVRVAAGLDVGGWVANDADGSVRVVAEGARPELERLLDALEHGPAGARVDRVATTWGGAVGAFRGFGVRSSAHPGD